MNSVKNQVKIVRPDVCYEESFRSAFNELTTESDRVAWGYLGEAMHVQYFQMSFDAYVAELLRREFQPPPGFVCDTAYWGVVNGEVVGRVSLRHELNDFLKIKGGHIGYIVRPSARGKGVATEMLRQILLTQRAKDIGSLLLTCDADNEHSEKIIRKAGGLLENILDMGPDKPRKKRFWIHLNNKVDIVLEQSLDLVAIRGFYESCGYFGAVLKDDYIVLARNSSTIIGAVRLVYEHGIFLLRGMFIRQDWQRQRIGLRMLKVFEQLATQKKLEEIFLICGVHLENFYGQIGFKPVKDIKDVPAFLVDRSVGYEKQHGPQLIMRRFKRICK